MDEMEIVRKITHMFYLFRKENMISNDKHHHPLGHRDLMMLDAISKLNDGDLVKMSDISTYFHITPAAISQIIKNFEKKNWVERILLDNDRRSVYIRVSPEAIGLIEHCEHHMTEKLVTFIEALGKEDSEAFVRILEKALIFTKDIKNEKE